MKWLPSVFALAGLAFAGFFVMTDKANAGEFKLTDYQPRGIRNNNPGNIEFNVYNDWLGQVGSDGRYAVFSEAVYGIRALAKLLLNYERKYGLNTVEGIVSRWAPPTENKTGAYVRSVASRLSIDPLQAFDVAGRLPELVKAIIHHENGQQPYSDQEVNQAIGMV